MPMQNLFTPTQNTSIYCWYSWLDSSWVGVFYLCQQQKNNWGIWRCWPCHRSRCLTPDWPSRPHTGSPAPPPPSRQRVPPEARSDACARPPAPGQDTRCFLRSTRQCTWSRWPAVCKPTRKRDVKQKVCVRYPLSLPVTVLRRHRQ